jgi:hypothetical protein
MSIIFRSILAVVLLSTVGVSTMLGEPVPKGDQKPPAPPSDNFGRPDGICGPVSWAMVDPATNKLILSPCVALQYRRLNSPLVKR